MLLLDASRGGGGGGQESITPVMRNFPKSKPESRFFRENLL